MRDEDAIAKAAIDTVMRLVGSYTSGRDKSDAIASLMLTAYNMLRALEGDKFVTGWLESALQDVANNPPAFEIKRLN